MRPTPSKPFSENRVAKILSLRQRVISEELNDLPIVCSLLRATDVRPFSQLRIVQELIPSPRAVSFWERPKSSRFFRM